MNLESDKVTLLQVRNEQDWDYTRPVKGIAVYLHEDCDPVRLEFPGTGIVLNLPR